MSTVADFPEEAEEELGSFSRRIWRGSQEAYTPWDRNAKVHTDSRRRLWVLISAKWDWQMSDRVDKADLQRAKKEAGETKYPGPSMQLLICTVSDQGPQVSMQHYAYQPSLSKL